MKRKTPPKYETLGGVFHVYSIRIISDKIAFVNKKII